MTSRRFVRPAMKRAASILALAGLAVLAACSGNAPTGPSSVSPEQVRQSAVSGTESRSYSGYIIATGRKR